MNPRLTVTAAVAVILASVSVYPLIQGDTWFWAGAGAVITAAAAGTVTRLPARQAAAAATVLALIAASPLLASPAWPWKVLGAVIVAAAAASRARTGVLRALGALISYLAALLIYLNLVFAARLSVAAVVPTVGSLRWLWTLASQGLAERALAPPVPGTAGVTLLAAGGIGLMAAATDLLTVRLRSPAIAGLPLLALYSVRITTSARQGGTGAAVVFCLGMIGYLALLAAGGRDRLRLWGRLVTVRHSPADDQAQAPHAPDTRALAASGRRIGLAAACIALAFPLLIPGVGVHDLFHSEGTRKGTGTASGRGQITLPDPLVQMNTQLQHPAQQTVLTYRTNAADPQQQYLQVYVLNYDRDTEQWTLVPPAPNGSTQVSSGPLRAAPGVARGVPRSRTTTEVRVSAGVVGSSSTMAVLPLPYAPEALTVPGSWLEDDTTLMVYSTEQQLSGLSYTVTGAQFHPGRRVLGLPALYPLSIKGSYLGFPPGPRRELAKLAARITRGDRTPIARARALQRYFTTPSNGFTYKLGVTLKPGMAGLTQFLFHSKQGFCQQFAIAMAALAREVGIPSRIAVGYTAGTEQADGTWKVTTANAHAWPELYFRDVGWLRFEPTPGGAAGTASAPDYSDAGLPGTRVLPGTRTAAGGAAGVKLGPASSNPGFAHIRRPAPGADGPSQATGQSIAALILLAVAVILGLALVTPLTARWLIRRRRLALLGRGTRARGQDTQALDARLAHAAWGEFRDSLADYGLACGANESPRALAARVASTVHLDPVTRGALYRIASAEERARYATVPLTSRTLRADTAAVRRALAREAHWLVRWRAWLLPASTLTPIRRGLAVTLGIGFASARAAAP